MKNVTILLAVVAMLALAGSASGAYWQVASGYYDVGANWDTGVPLSNARAGIRNDGTCMIRYPQVCGEIQAGYYTDGTGHFVMVAGESADLVAITLQIGAYIPYDDPTSSPSCQPWGSFTQKAGNLLTNYIASAIDGTYQPGRGHGLYTISGGNLESKVYGQGGYPCRNGYEISGNNDWEGLSRFVFDNTQPDGVAATIDMNAGYLQNSVSTLELILADDGTSVPWTVDGRAATFLYLADTDTTATIHINPGGASFSQGDKVVILTVPTSGDLHYNDSATVGLVSDDPNWTLIDEAEGARWALKAVYQAITPGDTDGDGDVDAADYGTWQANFGLTPSNPGCRVDWAPSWEDGDFDYDKDVDAADYGTWQANFGTTPSGSVPEPITLTLLGLGGLALLKRRRQ